ncbi:hypothetical protein [Cyanothece sp. BG0011]|uniref:hypothetical protein n=1 Tax=Cyanothece sp. BG0011 TaxID=2082950 RepID=UPI0013004BDD|nr:hypothetical protein [Cyanothece sp. BG0011]
MNNQPLIDAIVIWRGFGYPHKPNNPWDSKCRLTPASFNRDRYFLQRNREKSAFYELNNLFNY